jgi:drug/metabolite transporter (DMT)-like permease
MRGQFQGYLYLTLAMLTVASTVTASKIIAAGMPPFTATALRFAVAFPLFVMLMRWNGARLPRLRWRQWAILVVQAGAGSVGYTTLLIAGLRLTTAADAGVIIGTLPIVSAALSIVVLGERPHPSILLSIALSAAGVLSIAVSPQAGGGTMLGNGLVLGAVICESLFILLNKTLSTAVPPLTQSTLMTGIGLIVAAIPALGEAASATAFSGEAIAAVLYYALVPTVLGFLLWYAGAERVSGLEASLFTAVAPASAVLMASVVLGERLSLNQLVGVGCVLAAVAGLGLSRRRRTPMAS